MRKLALTLMLTIAAAVAGAEAHSIYDFTMRSIDGDHVSLKSYHGKVVLLVNVASKCGLTPQYAGLESVYRKFKDQGLVVLGLPCNQFMGQEPGSEAEIKTFCSTNYDVTFPLTSKVEVNGAGAHPLYEWLRGAGAKYPGDITWNFEKFLIGRDGEVVQRFGPRTKPDDPAVISAIEQAVA